MGKAARFSWSCLTTSSISREGPDGEGPDGDEAAAGRDAPDRDTPDVETRAAARGVRGAGEASAIVVRRCAPSGAMSSLTRRKTGARRRPSLVQFWNLTSTTNSG